MIMITIIDYGMGNLKSVYKAFRKVGTEAVITSDPKVIDDASAIVLPGVGAFRDCMNNLNGLHVTDPILRSIEKGKPYLGICLGLQILFSKSEEFGSNPGLGVIRGSVKRFPENGLKVPHMGWNAVKLLRTPPIFSDIEDGSFFYFVHSYYVSAEDESVISGSTEYGIDFTSMIWKDNIFATQFHPEKSQQLGLKLLSAFSEFVKKEG
ncbi:MAG: imidazole glycerol phosphate synthase subunit HisH [Nitrospirota bacterium]|nr:MAG: imidazole glycerol phosphate synthase subunit HisH [Nitrospirota bacterium]